MSDLRNSLTVAQKLAFAAVATIVLLFAVRMYFWDGSGKTVPDKQLEPIVCRRDLNCWAKENMQQTNLCIRGIETKTEFDFRWTNKILEPKFTRFQWHNKAGLTITYSGDELMVQNQYGAFARTIYECDLDPLGKTVLATRIYPGRLPQDRNP